MKNSLYLTWNILIGLFVFTSNAEAARATTLILGKSKPELKTDMLPTGEENNSAPAITTISNETSSVANVTKLTGIPQIDYIYDPNLPRELNGYNLTDYPFYNGVPEDIDFKCDGLHDGFYASVPHKCQVYHHCLFGTRYDFLCANYTAFDQKTFICHFASEVDCKNSPKYFSRNEALYKAATTTTSAPLKLPDLKRRPQSDHSGSRRKRPYRIRKPAYEYYDDAEDEYEDFPERDYYYEDEPPRSRRRKRPKPHTRDSFHDFKEEKEEDEEVNDDEGEEEEAERKNKHGGQHSAPSKSSYDRPRLPLKGKRRPSHDNERDRQDYSNDSRITKSKESDAEIRRQNEGDDVVKGKKGNHRSEYENSREEDRRNSESSKKGGNIHREKNRQEDRILKGVSKPFRKRTRPDSHDYSEDGDDYDRDQEEEVEVEDDDYYDDEKPNVRIYKNNNNNNNNHHIRPKYNPGKVDHDERPPRIQPKIKNEENGGRWRDDYRKRQEPLSDKSSTNQEKRRESEHKKTSNNKDPNFRIYQTSDENEDKHRDSVMSNPLRNEGGVRGESKKNSQNSRDRDHFLSGSRENTGYRHRDVIENRHKSKPNFLKEVSNEKNHDRESAVENGGINIASSDYRDEADDEKYIPNRKPQSENKERGDRPHSNRPGSSSKVAMKRKQVDPSEDKRSKSNEEEEEVKSGGSPDSNSQNTKNFSTGSDKYPPQRSQIDSSKSSKEIEEYKDYDEPVPAPRPAYITDISESSPEERIRKKPVEDKINPLSTKRNNPYRKVPEGFSNEKFQDEESPEKERETDYDEDRETDSYEENKRRGSSEIGEKLNTQVKEIKLPSRSESVLTRLNHESSNDDHREKQTLTHRLKVPFENSENTEELAPRAPKNSQAIISSRRRPFLPSRGGNPSLPRGLAPVGTRSLFKFPEKSASGSETERAENYNENARFRIPEKKPIEFRTKVSASIGVEQPRLTSYYFDESPFENSHQTHVAHSSSSDQSVYLAERPKQADGDYYSSGTHVGITGDEKNVGFSYGFERERGEAEKARQRLEMGSTLIRPGAENPKTNMKIMISSHRSGIQSQETSDNPLSGILQTSEGSTLYLEDKNNQNPRKETLSTGPLSFYNVPTPLKSSVQPSDGQTRLGPQVFHSENPKFKTTLVVPDHLVPKSSFSQPLKYSTNSPRLSNKPHINHQNAPRQPAASTISLEFYDDSSNRSGDSEEGDVLQRSSVLSNRQVPIRSHPQFPQFNRRHYREVLQYHQRNTRSNTNMLPVSPTSFRHA